jgi:hypothetical protein
VICPEFPELVVSDDGQIRGPRKWLKLFPNKTNPYLHFNIYRSPKWTQLSVHVVVCTAFHGPRPAGLLVRHLDGDPLNNRADNLAWGTFEENEADKVAHGRAARGESHPHVKLTEGQVRAIRAARAAGIKLSELSAEYRISQTQISAIAHRKVWRHLT